MLPQIKVEDLKIEKLGDAWAIVRSSGFYGNEDWWIAEGTDLIADRGGVLAARAGDGRLHGVATFQVPGRPNNDTLVVRMLLTFELSRSAPARNALLNSLKRIATKLECTHILLPIPGKRELRRAVPDYDRSGRGSCQLPN